MSKRVNLKAIQFDGLAPGGDETLTDVVVTTDTGEFTWSDALLTDTDVEVAKARSHKPFTFSAWVNPSSIADGVGGKGVILSKFGYHATQKRTEWVLTHIQGRVRCGLYDPVNTGTSGTTGAQLGIFTDAAVLTANAWTHVVVTFNGNPQLSNPGEAPQNPGDSELGDDGGFIIYINGQRIAEDATKTNRTGTYIVTRDTNAKVAIGATHYDTAAHPAGAHDPDFYHTLFEGKLADICVFNTELTAAQAAEIYNSGKVKDMTKHSAYSSLVSWWKLGDDLDSTGTDGIRDYVSTNHGTMQGQASIVTDPSLPTDRISAAKSDLSFMMPSTRGNKRSPSNLAGDSQVYVHGGLSGDMPTIDPSASTDGYATAPQRSLHLYWKAASTTAAVTAWGYSHASGQWAELLDTKGNPVKLETTDAAVDTYRVFEIEGIDRVYFKQSGTLLAATDLFAAAASTF